jgi:hypothetical protein
MEALHLLLFSRAPVAGASKTRLAADVGAEAAAEFHAACLQDLLDVCDDTARDLRPLPVLRHLFIAPPHDLPAFRTAGLTGLDEFAVHVQQGAHLGLRMAAAFQQVLGGADAPGRARALLFGSDLPLLTAAYLCRAAAALETAPLVLGPTLDGGYGLVGLRTPQPALFDRRDWSHGGVLARTLARAEELGLRCTLLDALPDVDMAADLARVRAHPRFPALSHRHAVRWIAQYTAAD